MHPFPCYLDALLSSTPARIRRKAQQWGLSQRLERDLFDLTRLTLRARRARSVRLAEFTLRAATRLEGRMHELRTRQQPRETRINHLWVRADIDVP